MSSFLKFLSAVKDTESEPTGKALIEARLDDKKAAALISNVDGDNIHKDGKALIYPQDLFTKSQEAYIFFVIRDSVMQQVTVLKRIGLYLPPSIKVNYGTQWEEMQMTVNQYLDTAKDAAQIADFGKTFDSMKSGYDSGGIQGAMGGLVNTAGGMIAARGAANAMDATFGSNFGQQLEKYSGTTVNPHMALLFKGVNFREFQFNFELMARTPKESENIRKIIKCFKAAMHPGNNSELGARYWTYPYNFDIYLCSPSTKYMFNIATSVLTQMNVDYNGSGFPSFFTKTGAPVQINMSLNFKELEVLTRERVLQDY
jgi:hypothetical protein